MSRLLAAALLLARPAAAAVTGGILIDAASGQVLREDNADAPHLSPALSQLMLLLLTAEERQLGALPLDARVAVSPAAVAAGRSGSGSRVPLRAGQTYLLSDLLKAMAINSANDAAVAVAEAIAGTVGSCLDLMNERASRLGMTATHFASLGGVRPVPSDADVTTARDAARLAQAVSAHSTLLQWTAMNGLPFDQGAVVLRNSNQLVAAVAGVDGVQASSYRDAKARTTTYDAVATAQRGALRLVAVVLGAADTSARYSAAAEWLEWGFAHYERLQIVRPGEPLDLRISIVDGAVPELTPVTAGGFSLLHARDEERDLQVRYQLPAQLTAPVPRNAAVGEIIVEEHGELLAVVPVVSPARIPSTSLLSSALP